MKKLSIGEFPVLDNDLVSSYIGQFINLLFITCTYH